MNENMNQLLTRIVNYTEGELHSIIIFDLSDGLPLYFSHNDSNLGDTLVGDNDIGHALENFENLKQVQKALDSFGDATDSGKLKYSIFKLTKGQLMVYFMELPDTKLAICFIVFSDISLGRLVSLGRNNINEIKEKIPEQ